MKNRQRPNFILVTPDQLRYDALGFTGHPVVKTPTLDGLARRGTIFSRAYIQNPVCVPSRACIQTGRYIHQHGCCYMETVVDDTPGLPPWETTFMERLQAAGYRTGAVGKMHMYPPKGFHHMRLTGGKGARWTKSAGLPIGLGPLGPTYAEWLEKRHPGGYEKIYEQRRKPEYKLHRTAIVNVLPLEEYVDYWIAEEAIGFLKTNHDRPFFLWIGFCGPHGPMDPPKPYDELYPFDKVPMPRQWDPKRLDETVIRRLISYYLALITLIDDQIGRIGKVMDELDLWKNTVFIFATDHGEMLGDRGRFGKGVFYEPVIRSPLFVTLPEGYPKPPDRVDDLVEVMDIAPTVLDYAGAGVPRIMTAESLRPVLEGKGGGKDVTLTEYVTNDRTRRAKCIVTRRYKYAFWGKDGPEEFYDLENDPEETRNLADDPAHKDELERHRKLMLDRVMWTEVPAHWHE